MTTKLTERTIFEAIANDTLDQLDYLEVAEWAKRKLVQLDKKNAKARERAASKKAEGDELREAIFEALTDEFEPISVIAERIQGPDVTASKVAYRLNTLFKEHRAEKGEVTLEGESGKRKVVAYKLA